MSEVESSVKETRTDRETEVEASNVSPSTQKSPTSQSHYLALFTVLILFVATGAAAFTNKWICSIKIDATTKTLTTERCHAIYDWSGNEGRLSFAKLPSWWMASVVCILLAFVLEILILWMLAVLAFFKRIMVGEKFVVGMSVLVTFLLAGTCAIWYLCYGDYPVPASADGSTCVISFSWSFYIGIGATVFSPTLLVVSLTNLKNS